MRISDWSSDVCSSDLFVPARQQDRIARLEREGKIGRPAAIVHDAMPLFDLVAVGGDKQQRLVACEQEQVGFRRARDQARAASHKTRSEERRGGQACVSTYSTRWVPSTKQKKDNQQ